MSKLNDKLSESLASHHELATKLCKILGKLHSKHGQNFSMSGSFVSMALDISEEKAYQLIKWFVDEQIVYRHYVPDSEDRGHYVYGLSGYPF